MKSTTKLNTESCMFFVYLNLCLRVQEANGGPVFFWCFAYHIFRWSECLLWRVYGALSSPASVISAGSPPGPVGRSGMKLCAVTDTIMICVYIVKSLYFSISWCGFLRLLSCVHLCTLWCALLSLIMPGTSKIFAVLYSTFSTVYDSGVMVICM